MTLVFWRIGRHINEEVLQHERAAYGQAVIPNLAEQLVERFRRRFAVKNLRRMMQLVEIFSEEEIVVTASRQLSRPHFIDLFSPKSSEARDSYIQKVSTERWSVRQ